MGLSLYNPKSRTFVTFTPPADGELPLAEKLLLNVLIELRVHSALLAAATPGADEPHDIRTDIVTLV